MVFALHLAALLQKKELAKEDYDACLFILMADDERYGGVKTALGDNYLLGKQEYPQDLLAAKRHNSINIGS